PPPQTGTVFNIWYNKWSGGDREDSFSSQTPAKGRLNVKNHTGYTRADANPSVAFFCLFFARGICPRGRDCEYLHRLPTSVFDVYSGQTDCFGREKHSDYRDDMGGVGTFSRQNRTLYVGRVHPTPDVEEVVARHFSEFGPIERIRVLPTRGVAFVTYKTEALAQFAKEAMAHQSLDNEEVLNVRWATVDPNPVSAKREAKRVEEQAAEAVKRALPDSFVRELEGDVDARKRRKEEGGFGLEGYDAPDSVWYARERAGALEAPEERKLIGGVEDRDGDVVGDEEAEDVDTVAGKANGDGGAPQEMENAGLFGASTLKALSGYQGPSTTAKDAKGDAKSEGPLVIYGSDDE
ncbi:MAG: hypothetical protein Q9162_007791, partial [Coniocarpon cinnabarinum]